MGAIPVFVRQQGQTLRPQLETGLRRELVLPHHDRDEVAIRVSRRPLAVDLLKVGPVFELWRDAEGAPGPGVVDLVDQREARTHVLRLQEPAAVGQLDLCLAVARPQETILNIEAAKAQILAVDEEQVDEGQEDDEVIGDDFESLYKGQISKSGAPILPSKRARKIPEKLHVSKQDLEDLKGSKEVKINTSTDESAESEVSLEDLKNNEDQTPEVNQEDAEPTNSQ